LPVFQGPSSSFLVPIVALSKDPTWMCQPDHDDVEALSNGQANAGILNATTLALNSTLASQHVQTLSIDQKLQQLSGSLMVASLLEVVVGGMGLIKPLLRFIGPLTVAPTIALIGLSLYKLPVIYAAPNPALALGSTVLVVFFSLYMSKIQVPIPTCRNGKEKTYLPIFQLLPILLALIVMWILCAVLTATNVFPDNPDHSLYFSRTDAKISIVQQTQFGFPSFSVAASIGFFAAVMASLVESVGDYFAAAKSCDVMPPPDHAISRGIFVEGLGSFLSGAVGAAHATTSYSGNIAMLSLTRTASRSVLVVAGIFLIVLSLIGKYADMTCNRNLLVVGVAFMSGLTVPSFVDQHGDMISTGNASADQVIKVALGTPMFLGGIIALLLDNTVPGTDEERGLVTWRQSHAVPDIDVSEEADPDRKSSDARAQSETATEQNAGRLTEEEVFAFSLLRGRFSNTCLLRAIPFLPPSMFKEKREDEEKQKGLSSDSPSTTPV
ncbi:hypothetical protein BaRGS_00000260, partial [Batillaria attramentaria]